MEIKHHWDDIRRVFKDALQSTQHYAIATVNEDGSPHITPIGSLFLQKNNKGFYCDEYPRTMNRNLEKNQRVCVLAVNSSGLYWFLSLFRGRFDKPPGVRLMGTVSERRKATDEEKAMWLKRVRPFRWFKGYKILWSNMNHIREITFDSFEPVRAGAMTRGLWDVAKDGEGEP